MKLNQKIDSYIGKYPQWETALNMLRQIMLDAGLNEDYKWSSPVYTLGGKNIAGIGATKKYVGIWFFQGSLLKDDHHVLVNAQEGKTKAMRQWRFHTGNEISPNLVKSYLLEAMENAKAGREIKPVRGVKLVVPEILKKALEAEDLDAAFEQLSLSKKRDYAEYVGSAKQEETRLRRIEKIIPMIKKGIGLNDKYK